MIYKTGMVVEGKITGIKPYGAFLVLNDGTVGLIHISELSDTFVRSIEQYVTVNQTVDVKVIDVDKDSGQLRLSIKALHKNYRKQMMFKKVKGVPEMIIGFKSIEEKMPIWIKESKI
jgi:predicted RNA-binding protein with RPS1 domain